MRISDWSSDVCSSDLQEILFECHMLAQDLGNVAYDYAVEHGKTGREKIVLVCRRYIELITSEIGSCAVLSEFAALEPKNRAVIAKRRDDFQKKFSELITEGIKDGSIREARSEEQTSELQSLM